MGKDRLNRLWRHVEATQVEIDRVAETVSIPKTTGSVFDPLDPRVDALRSGVGHPVMNRVDDPFHVLLDHPGHLLDRL